MVLGAISSLRRAEGKAPPSKSWFKEWWKQQPLRKITTKPISQVRIIAQDNYEVKVWFKRYQEVIQKHNIDQKDIWNFDETGFRIGCPKGQVIYVPLEVKEVRIN